ncbi:50S ribosomal protein L6 [Vicingaceae bacterium]|nr:50S ribosomal protein L6 [Vicingaceae bacterium]MDC1452160.1 50S ribosomal protein L6 [Vicingaceae bacterium]
MSRIGLAPIEVPAGIEITISDKNVVSVKGPKGELHQNVDSNITVKKEENSIVLERHSDQKDHKAKHGLYRSLINNMVEGVNNGFKKDLELVGVGYRASNRGQILELSLGFSHPIVMDIAPEVKVTTASERGKNPIITLESFDKQLIGQVAAKIKSMRKPEPYKGKGVRFVGEYIRRKAGKSAAK